MKDFFGLEIRVGDIVAYSSGSRWSGFHEPKKARVAAIREETDQRGYSETWLTLERRVALPGGRREVRPIELPMRDRPVFKSPVWNDSLCS